MQDAQERERAALQQLNDAIRQANEMSVRAQAAQQVAESRENVILTFKNKDGKVLEIKNLDELSEDKLWLGLRCRNFKEGTLGIDSNLQPPFRHKPHTEIAQYLAGEIPPLGLYGDGAEKPRPSLFARSVK